jgi:hypothetical protein
MGDAFRGLVPGLLIMGAILGALALGAMQLVASLIDVDVSVSLERSQEDSQ